MPYPNPRPLISFDWAIKRLLRQKANYAILEGFLSELLRRDVVIVAMPESETNKDGPDDKSNKVDVLCEDQQGELMLIELQYYSEWDFLHRMLFGASKLITNYLQAGDAYAHIKKVYSINIVYFELGQGTDYVYHGTTSFTGLHQHDTLQISPTQQQKLKKEAIYQIFPEYYIIKVNSFDNVAKDTLDEWIYYFKNHALPERYAAKGLEKVAAQLKIDAMTTQEKIDYEAHLKNLAISHSMLETASLEGELKGEMKGEMKKGKSTAQKLILRGFANEDIADITGLTTDLVDEIRKAMN
jgi:predicted transposase/invertase (TIGR01784 family)